MGLLGALFTPWRASSSCRATLGRCMETVGLRVGEGQGKFLQRELINPQRVQSQAVLTSQVWRWQESKGFILEHPGIRCCCSGASPTSQPPASLAATELTSTWKGLLGMCSPPKRMVMTYLPGSGAV